MQQSYRSERRKRYMIHFIESKVKPYVFILHDCHFKFIYLFIYKIWVPGWARVVQIRLNKCIPKHSTKIWC